ncbi:conserved hypothetical protein [Desulfamplus magnetovallimortis]|uniref:Uncharacterized protein n=1 Tax=Desulfamplus magnetovallimortis TaxID=1246637 RepID=A0A1W1HFL6_9BACT|nr:hypothetical protein [Desulfamplus magnetovallimortis]SLM31274.1 conserved hypothetical protein [Desulfamplus magnetovallimortis]
METAHVLKNTQIMDTLDGILPSVRQLTPVDKLKLIRILAEDLDKNKYMFPFEPDKIYDLPTPYNTFGAAEILIEKLKQPDTEV